MSSPTTVRKLPFLAAGRVEFRGPAPECALAVRHALQRDVRDVVEQRDRGVQEAVGKGLLGVREGEQAFAQHGAVAEPKAANRADRVGRPSSFDAALLDGGVPAIMSVEVPKHRLHPADRCVDHRALFEFDHSWVFSKGWREAFRDAARLATVSPVSTVLTMTHWNSLDSGSRFRGVSST